MSNPRGFKQKLATVSRLWEQQDYYNAFVEVQSMLKIWPGNAHLHILWASLIQLQEDTEHELNEAKGALLKAVDLDRGSPAASIELGYFLDSVEDDPTAAAKAFGEGVTTAREMLIEGLIGQAKAFRQMDKMDEFRQCLMEILHLSRFEAIPKKSHVEDAGEDIIFGSTSGHFYAGQLKGRHAAQIQELLNELALDRSA